MILRGQDVIKKTLGRGYATPRYLQSGSRQTIAGHLWPFRSQLVPAAFHEIQIGEGDSICVVEYADKALSLDAPVAILVHGLNGSYLSGYIQRFAQKFSDAGYRVYCMNMRNCGPGLGLSARAYNAGVSDDFVKVYEFARQNNPRSRIFAAGFSLGANVVLKALVENPELDLLAAAVSPPADLPACSKKLRRVENRLFDWLFLGQTVQEFRKIRPHLREQPRFRFSLLKGLRDFDNAVTAPLSGYDSADEYYETVSSAPHLDVIRQQTLVLSAEDDPIIDNACFLEYNGAAPLDIVVLKKGGHVAFLHEDPKLRRYMDELVFQWADKRIRMPLIG